MMTILPILVSVAILFAGRRVFWFVVAVIGFSLGMKLAPMFIEGAAETTMLLISIGIGVLAALAAIFVQKVAIGVAGFLVGGYAAFVGMNRLNLDLGHLNWVPMVCLGVVGVILAAVVFEWALILISSLAGAYLLVTAIDLRENLEFPLFVILTVAGVVVQAQSMRKRSPGNKKQEKSEE